MSSKRIALPTIPLAEAPELPEEIVITEPVIVGADWHVPHHDSWIIRKLVEIAHRDGIKTLVIAGDFLSLDAFWMGGIAKRPGTVEFETELINGKLMISRMLQWFEKIYWLRGNHEARLMRQTQGSIDMRLLKGMLIMGTEHRHGQTFTQEMMEMDRRLVITNRDYVLVKHGHFPEDLWRVCHGDGGSASIPTNAAIAKADSYDCNVMQGHDHLWGARQTKNGKYLGVDIGCCMDPSLAEYKMLNTKTYPQWVRGFATITNGKMSPYADRFTDWNKELPGTRPWSARGIEAS